MRKQLDKPDNPSCPTEIKESGLIDCLDGNTFKIAWNKKSKYLYSAERLKGVLAPQNGWPTLQDAADHLCGCIDDPQVGEGKEK